eukprot:6463630-Alexandrium_andersonii.AAC.1
MRPQTDQLASEGTCALQKCADWQMCRSELWLSRLDSKVLNRIVSGQRGSGSGSRMESGSGRR